MAVTRTGDVVTIQNNNQTGSQSITVPADATCCVVIATTYRASANWMAANPFSLASSNLTTVQKTDEQTDNGHVWIGYLVNPSTGSQTFAWDWGSAPSEGVNTCVVFYKGLDTSSPIKSSGQQLTADADLTGLTAAAGDMMVGGCYSYDNAPTVTDSSQTQLAVIGRYYSCYGGFAQKDGGTGFYISGTNYATCVGLVLAQYVSSSSVSSASSSSTSKSSVSSASSNSVSSASSQSSASGSQSSQSSQSSPSVSETKSSESVTKTSTSSQSSSSVSISVTQSSTSVTKSSTSSASSQSIPAPGTMEPFEDVIGNWIIETDTSGTGSDVTRSSEQKYAGDYSAKCVTTNSSAKAQVRDVISSPWASVPSADPGEYIWQRAMVYIPAATTDALTGAEYLTLAGFYVSGTGRGWLLKIKAGAVMYGSGEYNSTQYDFTFYDTFPTDQWVELEIGLNSQNTVAGCRSFIVMVNGYPYGWYRLGQSGTNYDRVAMGILDTNSNDDLAVYIDNWYIYNNLTAPSGTDHRLTSDPTELDFKVLSGKHIDIQYISWYRAAADWLDTTHGTGGVRLQLGPNVDLQRDNLDDSGWAEIELDWADGTDPGYPPGDIIYDYFFAAMVAFKKCHPAEQNLEIVFLYDYDDSGTTELCYESWADSQIVYAKWEIPEAAAGGKIPEPGDKIHVRWEKVTSTDLKVEVDYYDASASYWHLNVISDQRDMTNSNGVNWFDGKHNWVSITTETSKYSVRTLNYGTLGTYSSISCQSSTSSSSISISQTKSSSSSSSESVSVTKSSASSSSTSISQTKSSSSSSSVSISQTKSSESCSSISISLTKTSSSVSVSQTKSSFSSESISQTKSSSSSESVSVTKSSPSSSSKSVSISITKSSSSSESVSVTKSSTSSSSVSISQTKTNSSVSVSQTKSSFSSESVSVTKSSTSSSSISISQTKSSCSSSISGSKTSSSISISQTKTSSSVSISQTKSSSSSISISQTKTSSSVSISQTKSSASSESISQTKTSSSISVSQTKSSESLSSESSFSSSWSQSVSSQSISQSSSSFSISITKSSSSCVSISQTKTSSSISLSSSSESVSLTKSSSSVSISITKSSCSSISVSLTKSSSSIFSISSSSISVSSSSFSISSSSSFSSYSLRPIVCTFEMKTVQRSFVMKSVNRDYEMTAARADEDAVGG